MNDYLVLWDIDWVFYDRKLNPDEVKIIKTCKLEDISRGEFNATPGLIQVMKQFPRDVQGIISNGVGSEQRAKIRGFDCEDYINPNLIYISQEQAIKDVEKEGKQWDYEFAEKLNEAKRKVSIEGAKLEDLVDIKRPEVKAVREWEKPSPRMIAEAVARYEEYLRDKYNEKVFINPKRVFLIGDDIKDMQAINAYCGKGIWVNKKPNEEPDPVCINHSYFEIDHNHYSAIPLIIRNGLRRS